MPYSPSPKWQVGKSFKGFSYFSSAMPDHAVAISISADDEFKLFNSDNEIIGMGDHHDSCLLYTSDAADE